MTRSCRMSSKQNANYMKEAQKLVLSEALKDIGQTVSAIYEEQSPEVFAAIEISPIGKVKIKIVIDVSARANVFDGSVKVDVTPVLSKHSVKRSVQGADPDQGVLPLNGVNKPSSIPPDVDEQPPNPPAKAPSPFPDDPVAATPKRRGRPPSSKKAPPAPPTHHHVPVTGDSDGDGEKGEGFD
jgi:hypothetical protein